MGGMISDPAARELQAQRALAHHEERFQALAKRASDFALICDDAGTITYVTPGVVDAFGYQPTELLGRLVWELVHPEDLGVLRPVFRAAVTTPGPQPPVPVRLKHVDGSWRWAEESLTNLLDSPAVRGIVANVRDIHDARLAQDQLRASERLY